MDVRFHAVGGAGMSSSTFLPLLSPSRTWYGPHQTTSNSPLRRYSGTSTHQCCPSSCEDPFVRPHAFVVGVSQQAWRAPSRRYPQLHACNHSRSKIHVHYMSFWGKPRENGSASLISLERQQSKTVACQVLELYFCGQEVNVPFLVAEDSVRSEMLKNRLGGSLRKAIALRALGHC